MTDSFDTAQTSSPAGSLATLVASGDVVFRARQLTKRYGERLAVNGLDMEVRRGEIFGFLGPNGAGKTTTIRMALGLIAPTSGSVEILGRDVSQYGTMILPRVGALVEQPALYPFMSGRNNLRAIGTALGGVSAARVDATLDLVGLRDRAGDRVKTYSLGMKQRLGVAVALLRDPELLILDEPANGLDPAGIVEMRDLLRRLGADGKTILMSSHVLGEVRQICTRVAILHRGRLVVESTVEDLLRGQGELLVTVDRPREALAVVQAQPWGANAQLDGDQRIVTRAPNDRGDELNLFLINAGFTPGAIAERAVDLEDVFLRLTGAGVSDAHETGGAA